MKFWILLLFLIPNITFADSLRPALARAQEEQFNFQDAQALLTLDAALKQFEKDPRHMEDMEKLADVHLLQAFCYKNLGNAPSMKAALQEAARLNPSLEANEMLFPPSLIQQLELEKDHLWEKGAFASLTLESKPNGAMVFVNGAFKGKTPLKLNRYPLGEHYLYFQGEDKTAYRKIRLQSDAEIRVRLKKK